MPDLLAHVLLAYAAASVVSWRYEWITRPYVTAAMAGGLIPDLTKVQLLVPSSSVAYAIGHPFSWNALHTAGGVFVSITFGLAIIRSELRPRMFVMLVLGATTHLLADLGLKTPTGMTYPVLWPVTRIHIPSPGLYLSTEPGPTLVAIAVATTVAVADRYRL